VIYLAFPLPPHTGAFILFFSGTRQRIVELRRKQNRHLYAVLSPSVDENLQRIRIVLYYASLMLDYEEHQLFLLSLSKYERALRIANEFDAGRILYPEAVELLDEIFS
jgi:hypothetical protein